MCLLHESLLLRFGSLEYILNASFCLPQPLRDLIATGYIRGVKFVILQSRLSRVSVDLWNPMKRTICTELEAYSRLRSRALQASAILLSQGLTSPSFWR